MNSYWGIEINEAWGFELYVGTEMIMQAIKFGSISYETIYIFFWVSKSNLILAGVNTKNKVHIFW